MNTAFYIYGNIRLKEISILNSFEQVQENTIAGSAFSARLGSSAVAFIPDRVCALCNIIWYINMLIKLVFCIN